MYVLTLVPSEYPKVDFEVLHPADRSTVVVLSMELLAAVLDPSERCNRLRRLDNHRQRGLESIKVSQRQPFANAFMSFRLF